MFNRPLNNKLWKVWNMFKKCYIKGNESLFECRIETFVRIAYEDTLNNFTISFGMGWFSIIDKNSALNIRGDREFSK